MKKREGLVTLVLIMVSQKRVEGVLCVKQVPDEPVKCLDSLLGVLCVVELGGLRHETNGEDEVTSRHDRGPEDLGLPCRAGVKQTPNQGRGERESARGLQEREREGWG